MKWLVCWIELGTLLGCRSDEVGEWSTSAHVIWADACSQQRPVFLHLGNGPRVGRMLSDSLLNVVRAVNFPDSLLQTGRRVQIRFRLATADEQRVRICENIVPPERNPTQVKLVTIVSY